MMALFDTFSQMQMSVLLQVTRTIPLKKLRTTISLTHCDVRFLGWNLSLIIDKQTTVREVRTPHAAVMVVISCKRRSVWYPIGKPLPRLFLDKSQLVQLTYLWMAQAYSVHQVFDCPSSHTQVMITHWLVVAWVIPVTISTFAYFRGARIGTAGSSEYIYPGMFVLR